MCPYKVNISGRSFNIHDVNIIPRMNNRHLIVIANFSIDLEKNPDFRNVDFKDDLKIFNNKNLKFAGYVVSYGVSENFGHIVARDFSIILDIIRLSAVEAVQMNALEITRLIADSSGFKSNFPEGTVNQNEREFLIIIPVQNLNTSQNFKIGNVEFYRKSDNTDDKNIEATNNGKNESIWKDNVIRAKFFVRAKRFYDAIKIGYEAISRAIDIINIRTDTTFPSQKINQNLTNIEFDYFIYYSRVKIPPFVYCREMSTNAHVIFGMEFIKENTLVIREDANVFFKDINNLCSNLLTKNELNQEEKNVLLVLHWLRRATQEGSNKDKFVDLWIAFEFLLSGVKTRTLFTKEDIDLIKELINETEFNTEQKDAIVSKINMLNDSPLMKKFEYFIQILNISFSDEELKILRLMRNKRTDLIHGKKDILVTDEELNKMRTIIEKIIIAKINNIA